MSAEITCLKCGHKAMVDGEGDADEILRAGILRCDECGARMSYGVLMPRVVVSVDGPFVTLAIADGEPVKFDRQFATAIAQNILSVSK